MLEITAKPELKNSLFGLCGNFDGDARNDFNSSTGSVMLDADKFAQSWKIPGDGFCSIQSPSVRVTVFMPRSNCCKALGYKFSEAHNRVLPPTTNFNSICCSQWMPSLQKSILPKLFSVGIPTILPSVRTSVEILFTKDRNRKVAKKLARLRRSSGT